MSQTIRSLALALVLTLCAAAPALACGPLTTRDEIAFAIQENVYLPQGLVDVVALDETLGTATAQILSPGETSDLVYQVDLVRENGIWRVSRVGHIEGVPVTTT